VRKITKYAEQTKTSQGFYWQLSCDNVSPLIVTQNSKRQHIPCQTMIPRTWCYISLLGGKNPMNHISMNSKSAFQVLLNQLTCKYCPMSGLNHHEHWWGSRWNQVSCNKNGNTLLVLHTLYCCAQLTVSGYILYKCADVCCEYCVLWGRGLCDELITRTEKSNRLWCVVI
jgi:hypothetical protein